MLPRIFRRAVRHYRFNCRLIMCNDSANKKIAEILPPLHSFATQRWLLRPPAGLRGMSSAAVVMYLFCLGSLR